MKKRHCSIATLYPQKPLFIKQESKDSKEIFICINERLAAPLVAAGNVIGAY